MSELTKGRAFQLWEYHVSHGWLLIRSPAGPGIENSIDIVCVGVEYVAAPRHLGEITVVEPTAEDIEKLEGVLGKRLDPARVWAFQGSNSRSLVVAVSLSIREHFGAIFDSPRV